MSQSGNVVSRLEVRGLSLDDFFSENQFADTLAGLRWRVIRAFTDARSGPNKVETHGYIAGLNDDLVSLAAYLQRTIGEGAWVKVFSIDDLPRKFRRYSAREKEQLAGIVRYELLVRLLDLMEEMDCLWRINDQWWLPQSVLDEYGLMFKSATANYRNERHFHGRPGRDRVRMRGLGFAPGTSTGR